MTVEDQVYEIEKAKETLVSMVGAEIERLLARVGQLRQILSNQAAREKGAKKSRKGKTVVHRARAKLVREALAKGPLTFEEIRAATGVDVVGIRAFLISHAFFAQRAPNGEHRYALKGPK